MRHNARQSDNNSCYYSAEPAGKTSCLHMDANREGLSNDDIKKKELIHTKLSSWLVSLVSLPLPGLPWISTRVALFVAETEQLSPAKGEKRSITLELRNDEINRLSGSCMVYFT